MFIFDFIRSTYSQYSKIELRIDQENYTLWEFFGVDWNQIETVKETVTWPYYNASIGENWPSNEMYESLSQNDDWLEAAEAAGLT